MSTRTPSLFLTYGLTMLKKELFTLVVVALTILGIFLVVHFAFGDFSLFGPSKEELKQQSVSQQAAITQLQDAQVSQQANALKNDESAQATQDQLTLSFQNRLKTDKTTQAILQAGEKAFQAASVPSKSASPGVSSQKQNNDAKALVGVFTGALPDPALTLRDPQSPRSLQLANAQFDMLEAAAAL